MKPCFFTKQNQKGKNQYESEEKKQQQKPRKRMSTPPKLQENPVDQDFSEINLSEDQNIIEQLIILVQTLLNEVKKFKEQNQILIENRENVEERLIRQEREMDGY